MTTYRIHRMTAGTWVPTPLCYRTLTEAILTQAELEAVPQCPLLAVIQEAK